MTAKDALAYARAGFSVLPLHVDRDGTCSCGCADPGCKSRGKHPREGWKKAQRSPATPKRVKAWWTRWPDANVGVVTGEVSGLVVLDVDGPEGEDALRQAGHGHVLDDPAPTVTTSRGRHLYFRHPGHPVPNRAGLLTKVDVRGDGGLVVAPPSVHYSGTAYEWTVGLTEAELPPWPDELVSTTTDTLAAPGFESIPEGQRNDALMRRASRYLNQGMTDEQVMRQVHADNRIECDPPLPDAEVSGIVASMVKTHRSSSGLAGLPEHVRPVEIIQKGRDEPDMTWVTADGRRWDVTAVAMTAQGATQLRRELLIAAGSPPVSVKVKGAAWGRLMEAMWGLVRVEAGYDRAEETRSWLEEWLFEVATFGTCLRGEHAGALRDLGDAATRGRAPEAVLDAGGRLWMRVEPFVGWLGLHHVRPPTTKEMAKRLGSAGFTKIRPRWDSHGRQAAYWDGAVELPQGWEDVVSLSEDRLRTHGVDQSGRHRPLGTVVAEHRHKERARQRMREEA